MIADLLSACPTIEDLDLNTCYRITDGTLSALEKHSPLHCLDLTNQALITAPAIVSFLCACGSQLRLLGLHWDGPAPFAAIASHAPNIQHIIISGLSLWPTRTPDLTREDFEFVKELLASCPRLKTVAPDWALDGDDILVFLDELEVSHGHVDPFSDHLNEWRQFGGTGLW
ncbi:hypothetical protein BDK51DRAFT_27908 [Blyttiomyces helicus]|uniref:F-box domain-containing protein n=1 Tax=Blyttiomyces helicus TaxID=388810 RepID=A0A4P9W2H2_9FUNG|nr:hypothetical protein BDK51DRAFT_27908 [Blyttiomyces helicus]|eukprot:RKO84988.1 hypothetical protein BDK51DRAFT_27908 [Blyttiomyces helicus]